MDEPDFDSFDAPQVTVTVVKDVTDRTVGFLVSKVPEPQAVSSEATQRVSEPKPWFKLKVAAELIDEIMGKPAFNEIKP